jgi:hypothetical protein
LCPPLWGNLLVRPRASFRPGLHVARAVDKSRGRRWQTRVNAVLREQRGDRKRRDQRAREGQDALAMDIRLRHRQAIRHTFGRAPARKSVGTHLPRVGAIT